MNKALLIISAAILIVIIGSSAIDAPSRASYADGSKVTGYSGGCSCHTSGGTAGSITLSGLDSTCIAGQTYALAITMKDATAQRWGFDMSVPTGTFKTTNPNLALTGTKNIHHGTVAPSAPPPSYTADSIFWTAPTKAGKITFKFACNAANGDGAVGGDHTYKGTFTTTVIVPVPIKLQSFTAALDGSKVKINWLTATELNTSRFEIERSTDKQTFTSVYEIAATGNSTSAKSYAYLDNVNNISGSIYYRLKSIDKSGAISISEVAVVEVKSINNLISNIYPNPVHAGQSVKLIYTSDKSSIITFSVVNSLGKKLSTQSLPVTKGSNLLSLPIGRISTGNYYLTATLNNATIQTMPLIVQ